MKIAYLISQYPAPSHTFIRREIQELRRQGLDIDTFSIHRPKDGEVLSDVDRQCVASTWYVLPKSFFRILCNNVAMFFRRPRAYLRTLVQTLRHRQAGAKSLLWSFFYFLEAMLLAEQLEARQVRHLHNHFANPAANVGLAVSRYLGITWSLSLHGLSDFESQMTRLLPKKVAAASFVACATQYGRAQTMRLTPPTQWRKPFVCRCGLEPDKFEHRSRPNGDSPRLKILCVARLSPEKGHVGLIQAFAMATRQGMDAELLLIGGGVDEARIRAAVKEARLESRVRLLGIQPEEVVIETMLQCDFFVLASFMEGLPMVLMEALALQLPTIAPMITGIPELIEHRRTGLLFTVGDWSELAEQMQELARDANLRAQLAEAGRARVIEQFNIENAVAPLYQQFLALDPSPAATDANEPCLQLAQSSSE